MTSSEVQEWIRRLTATVDARLLDGNTTVSVKVPTPITRHWIMPVMPEIDFATHFADNGALPNEVKIEKILYDRVSYREPEVIQRNGGIEVIPGWALYQRSGVTRK